MTDAVVAADLNDGFVSYAARIDQWIDIRVQIVEGPTSAAMTH
jgi:hypothetical protein